MNKTRIAVLAVALIAGVGAFMMMMGSQPEVQQIAPVVQEKTTRVLVADRDMQRGERLTADSVKWLEWPDKALSPSFITEATGGDPEQIAQTVARTAMVAGEPITEAKVVRAGSSGLLAAVLAPGMRAVAMRITPETAVAGFILPGDRVDVYYSEGEGSTSATKVLFEDVRVLAINTIYSENPETPVIEGATATVELAPVDAENFINARSARGQLSLALRSVFAPDEEVPVRRSNNVTVIRYGRS